MGVPKFYRWISERYPNMSRVISDSQIPDFDNFYLDMNGIIHQCSHLNEDNCETNVTEEEIFRNIFHYIDFLFRMIKPKKVFFMAIDGVAPRAKMNQQRARRFRAGKDRTRKLKILAEKTSRTFEETAAKHFDTNAITPGTQFMANLDEQLRYFIHVKLTTDPLWEGVDVHLSGHLTPGEGEHKIMEFIRYTRSQPGYNVNTRHCLYGLDADLIMLGLVTHEMHFALLREEVKYGSKKISKILSPEEITWHLLHTCLLRDYIDLEFHSLREKLQFPYDLDRIVDDWILMAYLVGNDFIPHLPHVHINEEALSILWDIYKLVLPTLDGYLNDSGDLNLSRFEIYLIELGKLDQQRYANENDSFKHLDKFNRRKKHSSKSKSQSESDGFDLAVLEKLPAEEKHEPKSPEVLSETEENELSSDSSTIEEESDSENARKKTFGKKLDQFDLDQLPLIEAEFRQHKNHYYRDKMKLNITSTEQLQLYVNEYIEALQWILKYYYQGCQSWSWFYPHHYAPYLSDLKNFKDLKFELTTGVPFKPFEQLLSVLPPTSRQLLPACLQSLMTDPQSPLLEFYPEDFQLDQNEKKQDWEAIVLLPFIAEELLLNTITQCYPQLNSAEQTRNQHIPSLCFHTRENLQPVGDSLKPNPYFPPINETRAGWREFSSDYEGFTVEQMKFGRFDQKEMIVFPRFPILNVLPYKYAFKSNAVNLFESRSRTTTLVLSLTHQPDRDLISYNEQWNPKAENPSPPFEIKRVQPLLERYLGKRVFVNWPHIQHGIVCAISDYRKIYVWSDIPGESYFYSEPVDPEASFDWKNYTQPPVYLCDHPFETPSENNAKKKTVWQAIPLNERDAEIEYVKALNLNRFYENRQGVAIGPIPLLLYVSPLIGYRTVCSSKSEKCRTNLCFSNQVLAYPLQTTLFQIPNYQSPIDRMPQTINDYLKINDPIFALQMPFYSSSGHVQAVNRDAHGQISISCQLEAADQAKQPDVLSSAAKLQQYQLRYYAAHEIAEQLKTAPSVISKLTGNVNVLGSKRARRRPNPTNVGLSWKMNKPLKQLNGYTRKIDQVWYYSETVIPILKEYMSKFPEIIEELISKPKEDNYFEKNIWPDKKPKHELQEVRKWIKSLPTYPIPLTDASWKILDTPVIAEVDKLVKSFHTKQTAKNTEKKSKTVSLDPAKIFKAEESLGMCNPDSTAQFFLLDRVVSVRLGTGVPLGARGTVVGIMHGRTNLDTFYEILFDNLPANSLESILLGKNQQKCRIKVRSYHLLNYSHSLRTRSNDYQTQQSIPPTVYGWNQHPNEQAGRYSQSNRASSSTGTKPKSAPPMTSNERPFFGKENNPKPPRLQQHNQQAYPTENAMPNPLFLPSVPMNAMGAVPFPPSNGVFYSGMQAPNPFGQPWDPRSTQYYENPQMPSYPVSPPNFPLQPYPLAPSAPFDYAQQPPVSIAASNIPPAPNPLAVNSTLSCDAQPFEPQQSPTIRPADQQNL